MPVRPVIAKLALQSLPDGVALLAGTSHAPRRVSDLGLARAAAFIASHLHERITLADLADAACMSRYHFTRVFRAKNGITAMDFVRKARVDEAKKLLVRGELGLSETAATLGFCDQSHFTRAFRQATGLSPMKYQDLHAPSVRFSQACS